MDIGVSSKRRSDGASILVVDDSKTDRKIIGHILTKEGYIVYQAADGPAALDLLWGRKFDLLLCDVNMPGMNGYEVIQQAMKVPNFKNTPVAMLSSHSEEAYVVRGIEKGVSDYIVKPFTRSALVDRVRVILSRGEAVGPENTNRESSAEDSLSEFLGGSSSYTEPTCNVLLCSDQSNSMSRLLTTVLSVMQCNVTLVDRNSPAQKGIGKTMYDIVLFQAEDGTALGAKDSDSRRVRQTLAAYGLFPDDKILEFTFTSPADTSRDAIGDVSAKKQDIERFLSERHPNRVLRIPADIEEVRQRVANCAKNKQGQAWLLSHLRQSSSNVGIGRITVVDRNLQGYPLVFVDSAFLTFTGYSSDELLGEPMSRFEGPGTDAHTSAEIADAIEKGLETNVVVQHYRKDGSPFWNFLHLKPIRDHQGNVFRMVGVHRAVDPNDDRTLMNLGGQNNNIEGDDVRKGKASEPESSNESGKGEAPLPSSSAESPGDKEKLAEKDKLIAELQLKQRALMKDLEVQRSQVQSLMNHIAFLTQERHLLTEKNEAMLSEAASRGYIPQFHFDKEKANMSSGSWKEPLPVDIRRLFSELVPRSEPGIIALPFGSKKLSEQFKRCVTEHFKLPLYFDQVLLQRLRDQSRDIIRLQDVEKFWEENIQMSTAEQRCWRVIKSKPNHAVPEDFHPILDSLIRIHPDLRNFKKDKRACEMYKSATITSMFFSFNRKRNMKMSWEEFQASGLTEALYSCALASIETMFPFSLVQNRYLIDAFTELDWEQRGFIGIEALRSLDRKMLSDFLLQRIFAGAARKLARPGLMDFEDFVWFTLALNDRMTELSVVYWFRCLDEDEDGFLTEQDLRVYYDSKIQELGGVGEVESFNTMCRQLFDIVRPRQQGMISPKDITRYRSGDLFFDLVISLQSSNKAALGYI